MPLVLPAVPEGCEGALHAPVLPFCGTIPIRLEVGLAAGCSSLLWQAKSLGSLPRRPVVSRAMRNLSTLALAVLLLLPTSARSMGELGATPACRSAVEVALSGYAACDMTARSKDTRRPDAVKLAGELEKCRTKFEGKFFSALGRNGAENCTTETSAAFGTYLDGCVVAASEAAGGAALPNPLTCSADLATCETSLAACLATPTPAPTATPTPTPAPATPTPCAIVVSNGKGGTYTDNCDGTVTDSSTGLVWEQKTDDGGVHDKDNTYAWAVDADPWNFNGTAKTVFLDQLNCQGAFATGCTPWLGHSDWRLPTIVELSGRVSDGEAIGGIVDLTVVAPMINPIFGPTVASYYWSSSTYQDYYIPSIAWFVRFNNGVVSAGNKANILFVRAVRTGP